MGVLCVVLVFGGGWAGLASRRSSPVAAHPTHTSDESALADRSFLNDPNLLSSTPPGLGRAELFRKMMLSIGLVLGLGAGAWYLSKKVLPKVAHAPGKEIHILESAYLGPRKALHLVEVGHQRLLVGSTNETITTLAHLTDGWLEIPAQQVDDPVKV